MPVGNASLPEVLDAHTRRALARVHTSIPARVTAVNLAKNWIDAEVVTEAAFFDADGERTYEKRPPIPNVPIAWPRAGGFVVRFPIEVGDFVLLHFCEQSLAEWRSTGQVSQPVDARRHSGGYPFAVPGAFPDSEPMSPADLVALNAGAAIIGEDGGKKMKIGPSGIEFVPTGAVSAIMPVALGPPTVAAIGAMAAAAVASGLSDTASSAALTALLAYVDALLAAVVALPGGVGSGATAATASQKGAASSAVNAASTSNAASAVAGAATAGASAAAAAGIPSTLVRSF